jgi:2-oxoglutarate ferredoxin oxidoreductase subunit alpha
MPQRVEDLLVGDLFAGVSVERVLVPELNLGQYRLEVERLLPGIPVAGLNRVDGEMISPEQILEAAR